MSKSVLGIGLILVALAIVFATWYPRYKEENLRDDYLRACIKDQFDYARKYGGVPPREFEARDFCLKKYADRK